MTATAGYSIEFITNDNIQKVLRMEDWKKKNEGKVKQWMVEETEEEEFENYDYQSEDFKNNPVGFWN